jgi:hypothetical protein
MEGYPKTPCLIDVEGCIYTVQEQEKNKFFVTYESPRTHVSSIVETGIFVLSSGQTWHVECQSEIDERYRPGIIQAIESGLIGY